jgi:hypothetical protein
MQHKYLFRSGPPLPYGVVARLGDDKLVVLEGLQSSLLPRSVQQNNLPLLYSYIPFYSKKNTKNCSITITCCIYGAGRYDSDGGKSISRVIAKGGP